MSSSSAKRKRPADSDDDSGAEDFVEVKESSSSAASSGKEKKDKKAAKREAKRRKQEVVESEESDEDRPAPASSSAAAAADGDKDSNDEDAGFRKKSKGKGSKAAKKSSKDEDKKMKKDSDEDDEAEKEEKRTARKEKKERKEKKDKKEKKAPSAAPPKHTRGIKDWKAEGAGADVGPDGLFVHTWEEDKGERRSRFRQGYWTAEEDELLKEQFNKFCEDKGLDETDRLKLVTAKVQDKEHRRCWLLCAGAFKYRSVRGVHRRLVRIFHPGNHKGHWSEEDKAQLLRLAVEHNKSWVTISKIMGRLPATCRNTYDRINGNYAADFWSKNEEDALVEAVKALGSKQHFGGYTDIPWTQVSAMVGSRSPVQCLAKWRSDFSERRLGITWDDASELALVRAMLNDGGESRDEIYWHHLIPGREGPSCKRHFEMLIKRVPNSQYLSFLDLLDALADDLEESAEKKRGVSERADALLNPPAPPSDEDDEDDDDDDDEDGDEDGGKKGASSSSSSSSSKTKGAAKTTAAKPRAFISAARLDGSAADSDEDEAHAAARASAAAAAPKSDEEDDEGVKKRKKDKKEKKEKKDKKEKKEKKEKREKKSEKEASLSDSE